MKCHPGGHGVVINSWDSYHGWSKNAGWWFGSVPKMFFKLARVRTPLSVGVGNPNKEADESTTLVVYSCWRSISEKRQGIPSFWNRVSTSVDVREIVSDMMKSI